MRNRAAYFGIFTALALILGYVEMLIPIQFGIPGVKLGLANLVTILVLYKMGWKDALICCPHCIRRIYIQQSLCCFL